MPLFPEINTYYKGRTHNQLVVSEGVAPAEKWIPAATETVKFQYAYGPEGNQNVVIPKGKIVTLSGLEWDYETQHYVPALKVATASDAYVIGVNHHNVYERRRDRFSGNAPTVITREYIELPLFATEANAANIKFGAAWATDAAGLLGKYMKADDQGNFQLADPSSDSYNKVIGQVLAVETEIPPAGFLQYFLEMTNDEYSDFIKQMSYAPAPGVVGATGGYPLGTSYLTAANRRDWNKGIPKLTDGYFRARTALTGITLDNIKPSTMDATSATALATGTEYADSDAENDQVLSYKVSGDVTVTDGIVTVGADPRGAAIFIRLNDKLAMDALKSDDTNVYPEFSGANPADVKVYLRTVNATPNPDEFADTQVSPANIHIDYTNNMVVVYFTAACTAKLLLDATLLVNATPGIPTGWDFKGAVGAVRILSAEVMHELGKYIPDSDTYIRRKTNNGIS